MIQLGVGVHVVARRGAISLEIKGVTFAVVVTTVDVRVVVHTFICECGILAVRMRVRFNIFWCSVTFTGVSKATINVEGESSSFYGDRILVLVNILPVSQSWYSSL